MNCFSVFISFVFLLVAPYSMYAADEGSQLPTDWQHGRIRDFSQPDCTTKLKVVYESQASFELSYIVEFSRQSQENFSVTLSLLGEDGFEIYHKGLGFCQTAEPNDENPKTYNLKGTFWVPKQVLPHIDSAELIFFTERKGRFD